MLATDQEREDSGVWEEPASSSGYWDRAVITLRHRFSAIFIGIASGTVGALWLFRAANISLILIVLFLNTAFLCGLGAFLLLRHQRET